MASFLTTHPSIGSSTFAQPDWDELTNASLEGPSDFTANLYKYLNPEKIPTTAPGSEEDHGSQLSVEGPSDFTDRLLSYVGGQSLDAKAASDEDARVRDSGMKAGGGRVMSSLDSAKPSDRQSDGPSNFTAHLLSHLGGQSLDTKDTSGEDARVRDPGMKAGGGRVVSSLDSAKLSDRHSDGPSNFTEELFKYMLSQSQGVANSPGAVPITKYTTNLDTNARDDPIANTPRQGMKNTISADLFSESENDPAAIPITEHDTNLDIGGPCDFTMNMSHHLMMGTPFADHLTKLRPQDVATVASVPPQGRMPSTDALDRRILTVIKDPNTTLPDLDSEKSVKTRPMLKPKSRKTSSTTSLASGQLEMSSVPNRNRSTIDSITSPTVGHMDTSKVPPPIKSSTTPTVSQRNTPPITPVSSKCLLDAIRQVESQTRSPPTPRNAGAEMNLSERVVKHLQPTVSNEASQLADEITMPFTTDISDITEPLDSSTPIPPRISPHLVKQQDVVGEGNNAAPMTPRTSAPSAPQPDLSEENAMLRAQLEQMKTALQQEGSQIVILKTVLKAKDDHCQTVQEAFARKIVKAEAQIVASMKAHEEAGRVVAQVAAGTKEHMKAVLLQKDTKINSLETALKVKDDQCQAVQKEFAKKITEAEAQIVASMKAHEEEGSPVAQEAATTKEQMKAALPQKDDEINSLKTALKAKDDQCQALQEECSGKIAKAEAQVLTSTKAHEEERRVAQHEKAAMKCRIKAALLHRDSRIMSLKTALEAKEENYQELQEECARQIKVHENKRRADEQEAATVKQQMMADLLEKDRQISDLTTAIRARNNHQQAVHAECIITKKEEEMKRQADEQEAAAVQKNARLRLSAGLGAFAKKKRAAERGEKEARAKVAELEAAAVAAEEKIAAIVAEKEQQRGLIRDLQMELEVAAIAAGENTAAITAKNEEQMGIIRALRMELEAATTSARAAEEDRKRREAILCGEVDRRGKALMIAIGEKELPGVKDGRGRQGYRYVQRKAVVA